MTGSIAAYKSVLLLRALQQEGAEVEVEPCERAWPEVLDQHIGPDGEPSGKYEVLRVGQIEADALLVPVHAGECGVGPQ